MRKITLVSLAALALVAPAALAEDLMSQDFIKGGDEVLTLDLGGIINQFDTTLRLNGMNLRGDDITLERNGLKKSLSSFEGSGTWRFLSRNRIDVLYFEAKRTGSHVTDRQINIGDNVIPINVSLAAEAKDSFVLADYRYSFVKTPEIEFAAGLGVYGGQFKYSFSASLQHAGGPLQVNATASTTVPLPLIGATLDWYIDPRWKVSGGVSGLKAHIGSVDGSVLVANIATEYMLTRNFGLGLGYMYSDVNADVSKSSFNGHLGWKMNSVRGYAQLKF